MSESKSKTGNRVAVVAAVGVVAVAGAAVFVLTGIGRGDDHALVVDYATGLEGKNDPDAKLPSWVPDQATSVKEVIRTTGSERIMRFTSSVDLPDTCVPGEAVTKAATLTADWWPHGQEAKTDQVCDETWHVIVKGDTVYAYKPETTDQSGVS